MEFKGFRVLEAAILFTHLVRDLKLPSSSLKRQLVRSSESTALLLAEGEGRESWPDKKHFFTQARASHREAQTGLRIGRVRDEKILDLSDYIGAGTYKLTQWRA